MTPEKSQQFCLFLIRGQKRLPEKQLLGLTDIQVSLKSHKQIVNTLVQLDCERIKEGDKLTVSVNMGHKTVLWQTSLCNLILKCWLRSKKETVHDSSNCVSHLFTC